MSGMIERSSSAGSTAGPIRSTMHLTPTGSPSIGKPEARVVVPGSREMKSGNRPGWKSAGSTGSKKASCSFSTVSGGVSPSPREQRPDPRAVRDHAGVAGDRAGGGLDLTPRPSRHDAGDGLALADIGAGGTGLRGEAGDAAAGAEHREVGLVEADRILRGQQLREAAMDLVGIDVVVRHLRELHRGAHLRHVLRVGRPEVEPAAGHDQLLAEIVGQLAPEAVRLARQGDVVGRLVREPDDPRRPVRRPAVVPDRARLEDGDLLAVASEVVRSRKAHQAAADDDDVHAARSVSEQAGPGARPARLAIEPQARMPDRRRIATTS